MAIALPLFLEGCTSLDAVLPSAATYSPTWVELHNQKQYEADLAESRWTCSTLSHGVSAGTVALSGASGATGSGSTAWINPLSILGGLAFGLLNGFVNGFDWTGSKSITCLAVSMDNLTKLDGSAVMADYHAANVQQ